MWITRNERLRVDDRYDLIVVGAGVAGVAAALAGARRKLKTLLVEKTVLPGGLATVGYITIYLPLCDGNGRRLTGGIAEELLWLSIEDSYDNLAQRWRSRPERAQGEGARYRTTFNAPSFAAHLDRALIEEGVDIQFDTLFSDVLMDGGRITHVIADNRDGRTAYASPVVIDATGDALVAARANVPTAEGKNYLCYWGYYTDLDSIALAAAEQDVSKAVRMFMWGDCNGVSQPKDLPLVSGTKAADATEFVLRGREAALETLRSKDPKTFAFTAFPGMPQFRTSRMTRGDFALSYADSGRYFADSIGCCGDWRKPGVPFELPYGMMTVPGYENLLSVGRNASNADSEAWEVTRVIPVAAETGEAAGIAAALINGKDVHTVDIAALQREMAKGGTVIHL